MKNKLSAVIDTNIFISGVIVPNSFPYQIIRSWQNSLFDLIISNYIRTGIEIVLQRPKTQTKYHVEQSDILSLIQLLNT